MIDDEAPTITCPADQPQTVNPNECEAAVTVPFPFFDDNCGVAGVVNDFTGTDDASGIYPVGSNVLIENGVSVNITAGNIITFEPGTVIQAGDQLSARIEDCNPAVQALSESELPETALSENRPIGQLRVAPNPFRQQVNISVELLEAAPVSLIIYNALGRRVSVLALDETYAIGHQEWTFLRNDHPAGMYLVHLKVDDRVFVKKMIILE